MPNSLFRLIRGLLCFGIIAHLSGCAWLTSDEGYLRDQSQDYKAAQLTPSLVLPETVNGEVAQPLYGVKQLPDVNSTLEVDVPTPARVGLDLGRIGVRLRQVGDQNYLQIRNPPQNLYPLIMNFFAGYDVQFDVDPMSQTLTTQWYAYGASESKKGWFSKAWWFLSLKFLRDPGPQLYRLRFVVGPEQAGVVSLQIAYQKNEADRTDNRVQTWQSDLFEQEVVLAVISDFVDFMDATALGFVSDQSDLQAAFSLEEDANGFPVLVLIQGYAQAWELLLSLLAQMDVSIDDLDRKLGLFYLSLDEDRFQLRVTNVERGVLLTLQESDDKLSPKNFSRDFLTALQRQAALSDK